MTVAHRPGNKHLNADALSRIEENSSCKEYQSGTELSKLPCRGCQYCQRAHRKWGRFTEEVDDVVPLTAKGFKETKPRVINISALFVETSVENSDSNPPIPPDSAAAIGVKETAIPDTVWDLQLQEVGKNQEQDVNLIFLWNWLKNGTEPSEGAIFMANRASKYYWINRECFELELNVIWEG